MALGALDWRFFCMALIGGYAFVKKRALHKLHCKMEFGF